MSDSESVYLDAESDADGQESDGSDSESSKTVSPETFNSRSSSIASTTSSDDLFEPMDLSEQIQEYYDNIDISKWNDVNLDFLDFAHIYQMPESGNHYCFRPEILGNGTFGSVYKGVDASTLDSTTPREFAIKVCEREKDKTQIEMKVFDRLNGRTHPNVIKCFDHFEGPVNDFSTRDYMIMELSPIGDLFSAVQPTNASGIMVWMPLEERYCRHLIKGVAEGVRHLFGLGIAHGDIKSENILLFWANRRPARIQSDPGPDRYFLWITKLCDFTNSNIGIVGGQITCNREQCSIDTAAPETYYNANRIYDMKAADVYSIGAVLLSLLLGCHPLEPPNEIPFDPILGIDVSPVLLRDNTSDDLDWRELYIMVKRECTLLNRLVQQFNPTLRSLLLRTLDPLPQNRLTIDHFLADQWFQT